MTYPNGPNRNSFRRPADTRTNTATWVVGAIVVLAVVFSVFAMTRHGNNTNTASNNGTTATQRSTPSSPGPATTGTGGANPGTTR
jgi:hypothetical protein